MCASRLTADPAADWLTVTLLEGRSGLRLTGEADLCAAPTLRRAVAALPPGAREIHLQLAGLEFIDVAAARLLTERPGPPEVISHYPPRFLIRMIRLLWPAALKRLSLREAQLEPWPALGSKRPERQLPAGEGSRVPAPALPAA
jgi:hypothetical protein